MRGGGLLLSQSSVHYCTYNSKILTYIDELKTLIENIQRRFSYTPLLVTPSLKLTNLSENTHVSFQYNIH